MVTQRSYTREAADPYCLRAGEAEQLLAGHPWRRFAVLGDGLAEGAGEPAPGYTNEPWCDRIAAALRVHQPDLAYLNLGASNTSAAQVRATQLPTALVFAPDLALVACGSYDILQPDYDPAAVSAEIREIVAALTAKGSRVITVGPFDGSYSPAVPEQFRKSFQERIHSLSRSTREVAKDLGTLHIDLTWHPAGPEPDLYSSDGRYGSMRGHAISATEVIRGLGADLAKAGSQGQRPAEDQGQRRAEEQR